SNHGETLIRSKGGSSWHESDRFFPCIYQIRVFLSSHWIRHHSQYSILALQSHCDSSRNVIWSESRDADAQINLHSILKFESCSSC
ncbi:hypothetical protein PMAYCL1PPCAC_15618, partial [Pristionchus mayeri]